MKFKEKTFMEITSQEIVDLIDALGPATRIWFGDRRQRAAALRIKLAAILKVEDEAANGEPAAHINKNHMRAE